MISVSAEHNSGISELLDAIELELPSPADNEHPTVAHRNPYESRPNVDRPIAIVVSVGRM